VKKATATYSTPVMNHAYSVAKGSTVSSVMVMQEMKIKTLRSPCQRRKLGSA
jgi:hypothetical protein